jgi:hypothetical protein
MSRSEGHERLERVMWPKTPMTKPAIIIATKGRGIGPEGRVRVIEEPDRQEAPHGAVPIIRVHDRAEQRRRHRHGPSHGRLPARAVHGLVSYLATKLGKPILVEGPAGVGKTELAKALAQYLDRTLVRLQCYEGLDEAKALYEWNYRKQLCASRPRPTALAGSRCQDDIFGPSSCCSARSWPPSPPTSPVVLLIDEIDKTDQEFEAMLLELLSDFQISIPELGRFEAQTRPVSCSPRTTRAS